MTVQYRIPAIVTGTKEKNYCKTTNNLLGVWKLWRKAKREKASAFFVFFN